MDTFIGYKEKNVVNMDPDFFVANVNCHFIGGAVAYLIENFTTHHKIEGLKPAATWYGRKNCLLK